MVSGADLKSIHDAVKPDHMWLVLEVGDGAVLSVCGVNGERITKNYISCYMWLVLGVGVGGGAVLSVCGGNDELITKNYISCYMIFFYLDILIQLKIYTMTYSYINLIITFCMQLKEKFKIF